MSWKWERGELEDGRRRAVERSEDRLAADLDMSEACMGQVDPTEGVEEGRGGKG